MGFLVRAVSSVVGAVASYYAVKWTTKFLEEKPLEDRVADAKVMAGEAKVAMQAKLDELSAKVDSLIKSKTGE